MNDLAREQVVLNGVLFADPKIFIPALTRVAEVLTLDPSYSGTACPSDVAETVMCKASRTTSGYDSYGSLAALFVTKKYLLIQRTEDTPPPINIELLLIRGSIQSSVSCVNYYSLIEHPDGEYDGTGCDSQLPHAWLNLNTVVVENTDYVIGRGTRYLSIHLGNAEQDEDGITVPTTGLQPPGKHPLYYSRSSLRSVCEILSLDETDGNEIEDEEEFGVRNGG